MIGVLKPESPIFQMRSSFGNIRARQAFTAEYIGDLRRWRKTDHYLAAIARLIRDLGA